MQRLQNLGNRPFFAGVVTLHEDKTKLRYGTAILEAPGEKSTEEVCDFDESEDDDDNDDDEANDDDDIVYDDDNDDEANNDDHDAKRLKSSDEFP